MPTWNGLHPDPRVSYYLFLRREQGLPARAAHARVKRTDAMVVGLHGERRKLTSSWLTCAWMWLRDHVLPHASTQPNARMFGRPAWGRRLSDMWS